MKKHWILTAVVCLAQAAMAASPFEIIAIPDIQFYNDNPAPNLFTNQTSWIVANKTAENIVFVTGEGDNTNGASDTQWANAMAGWNQLNSVVPYSISIGNHDTYTTAPQTHGTGVANSLYYMGNPAQQGGSAYGGTSSDGQSFYQIFSAGGLNLLHLNLKYNPTDSSTVTWAQGILSANSGKPTMVTTHDYMNTDGSRSGVGNSVWSSLINNNSQIFMVLAGHNHGESRRMDTNLAGKQVPQILADYQSLANGGDGYLRKIQFDPTNSKISVSTYSPTIPGSQTDADSQFAYTANFDTTNNKITVIGDYAAPVAGTIALTGTFTENFDSMGTAGTAPPAGWTAGHFNPYIQQGTTGGNGATKVNDTLQVNDGSAGTTVPGLFNLGTTGAPDRALGSFARTTGNGDQFMQVGFTNESGSAIGSFALQFKGEQWRSSHTGTEVLTMWYSTDPTSGFVAMPGLTFTAPNKTGSGAIDGNLSGNFTNISSTFTPSGAVAPGGTFYLRWYDINDSGVADNYMAIDDFSITPSFSVPKILVWNAATYPAGNWNTTPGNQPWLVGITPSAFATGDNATFSHNNGATVAVDAAGVSAGQIAISNTAGTYTFSGGAITGTLVKSGGGTAVFQAANSFSSVALNGGTVQTQMNGALGAGAITLGGGTWQTTTNAQTAANAITVTTTSTIQTDTKLTLTNASGITGVGMSLVKTGSGVLELTTDNPSLGAASDTSTFTVNQGTLLLSTAGGNYSTGRGTLIVNSGATVASSLATVRINPSSAQKVIVNTGGTIAPGSVGPGNVGTINITSNLTLAGTLSLDLMSATVKDLLQVAPDNAGGIILTGSTLSLNLQYAPTVGSSILILEDTGGGTTDYTGTLGGYAAGASVPIGVYGSYSYTGTISYTGGTGANDIQLTNIQSATLGANLVWNAGSGTWDTQAGNKPWLNGVTASAFATNDNVTFSQDPAGGGTSSISVDAAGVTAATATISHAGGSYAFSGGQVNGKLVKSGAGSAVFNMPVNFSTAAVSGGSTTFAGTTSTLGSLDITGGAVAMTAGTTTLSNGGSVGASGRLDVSAVINVANPKVLSSAGTTNFNAGAAGTVATMNVSGGTATFNAGATTSVPALNVSAGTATINNTSIGAVAVSGTGQVNLGGSVNLLTVTGGAVTTTGTSAQVATADLSSPGTGTVTAAAASPLTITSTLKLADGITASISSSNSFKASSSGNLASNAVARTLSLSGGTMTCSAAAAPTAGLVGYWKLDETAGATIAADSSTGWYASWDTNGHTTPATAVLDPGTVTGTAPGANAVFTSAGKFGGAIQLTNSGAASSAPQGYIKLTGTAQAPNTGNIASNLGEKQFTLSAWIKQTGAGITTTSGTGGITAVPIISKGKSEGDGSAIDCNYILGITAAGKLAADYEQYGGGQNYPVTGSTTLSLNTWYNVAATYDGVAWKLYVNGTQDGTATVPADPRYDSIQNAAIGSALNSTGVSSGGFDGLIDDARIYNRALSASEVVALTGGPTLGGINLSATTLALIADSILNIDGAPSASFFDLVLAPGVTTPTILRIEGTNWDGVSDLASFFDVDAPNNANIRQIETDYATYVVLQVPEPATMALLALGGLALLRRRRK